MGVVPTRAACHIPSLSFLSIIFSSLSLTPPTLNNIASLRLHISLSLPPSLPPLFLSLLPFLPFFWGGGGGGGGGGKLWCSGGKLSPFNFLPLDEILTTNSGLGSADQVQFTATIFCCISWQCNVVKLSVAIHNQFVERGLLKIVVTPIYKHLDHAHKTPE